MDAGLAKTPARNEATGCCRMEGKSARGSKKESRLPGGSLFYLLCIGFEGFLRQVRAKRMRRLEPANRHGCRFTGSYTRIKTYLGRINLKTEPSPTWLSASTVPLWRIAICRTIESPRPVSPVSRLPSVLGRERSTR